MFDVGSSLQPLVEPAAMAQEFPYRNSDIRDRIEVVSQKLSETDTCLRIHTELCTQLNHQILKEIAEIRAYGLLVTKVGFILALALFGVELGKAAWPLIFDIATRSVH